MAKNVGIQGVGKPSRYEDPILGNIDPDSLLDDWIWALDPFGRYAMPMKVTVETRESLIVFDEFDHEMCVICNNHVASDAREIARGVLFDGNDFPVGRLSDQERMVLSVLYDSWTRETSDGFVYWERGEYGRSAPLNLDVEAGMERITDDVPWLAFWRELGKEQKPLAKFPNDVFLNLAGYGLVAPAEATEYRFQSLRGTFLGRKVAEFLLIGQRS